jgi:hypothetical protein
MRIFLPIVILILLFPLVLMGQGTPPMDPEQEQLWQSERPGTPPAPAEAGPVQHMKKLVKQEFNRTLVGSTFPPVDQWRPLSPKEKFHVFVAHTYSPRTFANAGIDALKDKMGSDDREYETGSMGFGQHYGIELATSETDVFFERFLIPTLLKQDPRYFRNPELPFFQRALYSVSRVVITRADNGGETFNASKILGGAASQALSDLYVPGQSQGMGPIRDRLTFNLLRDAGMNLFHEFWPDLRRKVFHR